MLVVAVVGAVVIVVGAIGVVVGIGVLKNVPEVVVGANVKLVYEASGVDVE